MADITFCELCGKESKQRTITASRSLVACDECCSDHQAELDTAVANAWDKKTAEIKATNNIDTNKQAVIQTKINTLNIQLSEISVKPIEIKK